ncbi:hypothetical protein ACHQM5_028325 [Ranunculus cassubicifolius]
MLKSIASMFLVFFFFLPLVLGSPVAASPTASASNIAIGSSIFKSSNNGTNCWLSPSGNFAFGFYPFDNNKIGIWIDKSSAKTLVWTAKVDGGVSSIQLTNDGMFVLRRSGVVPERLFDGVWQPAAYAIMSDNGNFMVYNTRSDIIWQSFDHPRNTLLAGQTMASDKSLISINSEYDLRFSGGNLVLEERYMDRRWETRYYKRGRPVALNLDSTGGLSLLNRDGLITKNITKGEEHVGKSTTIYRATLGTDGHLRVFGETIAADNGGEITELWHSYYSKYSVWFMLGFTLSAALALILFFFGLLLSCFVGNSEPGILLGSVGVGLSLLAFGFLFLMGRYPSYV